MTEDDKRLVEAIAALNEQEAAIMEVLTRLESRLSQVRTARNTLIAIERDEPTQFEGTLADAIRTVLKNHKGSLSPTEVRDKVKALGYDLNKHDNVMAAVHGVLKRLEEAHEADTKVWKNTPGQRYFWIGATTQQQPKNLRELLDMHFKPGDKVKVFAPGKGDEKE